MSDKLEEALHKQAFSAKLLSWSKWLFAAYFVGVSVFFIISFLNLSNQLNTTLEAIKKDNATQHQRTQDYTKCIAKTLLLPLAERKNIDFENCAIKADQTSFNRDDVNQQNSISSGTAPAVQAPQIIVRDSTKENGTPGGSSPPATTGSPPDPDPTEEAVNPAENSRVFTILDGILNDVDNSPVGGTLNKLGL